MDEIANLATRLTLPCGLNLPNRLVKAAMEPCLAEKGQPSEKHFRLHSEWSSGGFGLLITENVQVAPRYLGTPHDVVVPFPLPQEVPATWKAWAQSCEPPTLVQLCHAGLQSCRGLGRYFWEPSIAPSSMRLSMGDSLLARFCARLLFNTARVMDKKDIELVVQQFQAGAVLAHRSGFQGVQLHCSHGYLLAQFLSPRTNRRTDEYGNTPYNRLRLLFEIIDAIRACVPATFCLAIKLNSADFVKGGLSEDDALKNVEWVVEHGGVDLIEISGGTYENVVFMSPEKIEVEALKTGSSFDKGAPSSKTRAREAFFAEFSSRARSRVQQICPENPPLVLLTGGFRTRVGMADAIAAGHTDLIGIGRPACLDPHIASRMLDPTTSTAICPTGKIRGIGLWNTLVPVKLIGTGFNTVWHTWQLQRIASAKKIDLQLSALGALGALLPPWSSFVPLLACIPVVFAIMTILTKSIGSLF